MATEPVLAKDARVPARLDAVSIRVIAQGVPGLTQTGANLRDDVSVAVAGDAERIVREVVARATSFMRNSYRDTLTSKDIAAALRLRGEGQLAYGHISRDLPVRPLEFARVPGASGLFVMADAIVPLKNVIHAPLPAQPHLPESLLPSWLLFNGTPSSHLSKETTKRLRNLDQSLDAYYNHFRFLMTSVSDKTSMTDELDMAVTSLSRVRAVHTLMPAMLSLIHATVAESAKETGSTAKLFAATRALRAIVNNPQFGFEAYVHNALPALLTCVAGRALGSGDQAELRRLAANVLREVLALYGPPLAWVRATKTLLEVLTSDRSELPALYGAIVGLCALGPNVVKIALLPHIPALLQALQRIAKQIDELDQDPEETRHISSSTSASQTEFVAKLRTELRQVSSAVAEACRISAEELNLPAPTLVESLCF
jgi:transcription initiation factor TFIID subunit 6